VVSGSGGGAFFKSVGIKITGQEERI